MAPTLSLEVKKYSLSADNAASISTREKVLAALRPHLPISLPVYRRVQFSHVFGAASVVTNLPLSDSSEGTQPIQVASETPWSITFVDRSVRPDTEIWHFGSWELDSATASTEQEPKSVEIDKLLRNILSELKTLAVPTSMHQDVLDAQVKAVSTAAAGTNDDHKNVNAPVTTPMNNTTKDDDEQRDHGGFSRSDYGRHGADPNVLLWGAIHERTARRLEALQVLSTRFKTTLMPNHTFIWDVDAMNAERRTLREGSGLRWGELEMRHFDLVRSRTQIPRQKRTLAALPNLGIFPSTSTSAGKGEGDDIAMPVSWAFVGVDGSLTTLHVEPEYRGRGLAKAITTKLFKEKMGAFWEDGVTKFAHGYVIVGNKESHGMCTSLGGNDSWRSYWVRVDLARVQ